MTRKDFEAIANVIKNIPFTDEQDRVIVACRMADDVCSQANHNFNRERFLNACGVLTGAESRNQYTREQYESYTLP